MIGPKKYYTTNATAYLAQLKAGSEAMAERHAKLIEAGFEWDGMDGYTAPSGMTADEMEKLFEPGDRRK